MLNKRDFVLLAFVFLSGRHFGTGKLAPIPRALLVLLLPVVANVGVGRVVVFGRVHDDPVDDIAGVGDVVRVTEHAKPNSPPSPPGGEKRRRQGGTAAV